MAKGACLRSASPLVARRAGVDLDGFFLMSSGILVPRSALRYILFQRTAYLALTGNRVYRSVSRLSPSLALKAVVSLEAVFRGRAIRRQYSADMLGEYRDIEPWLPHSVSTILDIGCGVGGLDVLLHRHYGCDPRIGLYLVDRTSTSNTIYYGFWKEAAFYNSLDVTRLVLSENGVPSRSLHLIQVGPSRHLDVAIDADLVVSLLSWGFHYPVSTYLDQVHDILKRGGHLVMDIRKGTGGEKELKKRFAALHTISQTRKRTRVLAVK